MQRRSGGVPTFVPEPLPAAPVVGAPAGPKPRVVHIGDPEFGSFISAIPTTLVT